MSSPIIYGLIVFLHDLFTAIWIGGLLFLALIFFPTLKRMKIPNPEMKRFSLKVQDRLRIAVYISIIGLFITGILLAKQSGSAGLINFSSTYNSILSIKHFLIFIMISIGLFRSQGIHMQYKALQMNSENVQPSDNKQPISESMVTPQENQTMILFFINFALGIIVLFLSGLLSAF